MSRNDVVVIVTGEDWSGNPVPRAVRPGHAVCLRGEYGKRFDIRGPQAWACPECLEPVFTPTGAVIGPAQRHLWEAHGVSAPLLP